MTAIEVMKGRRSVRAYKDEAVPLESIKAIAEAGTYAPSGNGEQSAMIVAVTDRQMRDRLSELNAEARGMDTDPFYGAPAVLVVLADVNVSTYVQDGSLVMGNLMLAAHELGLGSCWVHRAEEQFEGEKGAVLLRELGVPEGYVGIGNCIVGYVEGECPAADERREGRVVYVK